MREMYGHTWEILRSDAAKAIESRVSRILDRNDF